MDHPIRNEGCPQTNHTLACASSVLAFYNLPASTEAAGPPQLHMGEYQVAQKPPQPRHRVQPHDGSSQGWKEQGLFASLGGVLEYVHSSLG